MLMYDFCLCIGNNSAGLGDQGEENPLARIEQTAGQPGYLKLHKQRTHRHRRF